MDAEARQSSQHWPPQQPGQAMIRRRGPVSTTVSAVSERFGCDPQREKLPGAGAFGQGDSDGADWDGGAAASCEMAGSAGAELGCFFGRLAVRGSRNSRAGERFSGIAALVASFVGGVFGGMEPVASGTSSACVSRLVNLDRVSFNSSIKVHPTRPSAKATIIETSTNRAKTCNAISRDPAPTGWHSIIRR
jgi:hypothetical protein